jgi:hypothetical protein
MRQRDPAERRALANLHRGQPGTYLQLKQTRGQLDVFAGKETGAEAERGLVARWAAARIEHGETEAVMICRDNRRRERLNDLARTWLRSEGELDRPVEIAGREWAVGERVIARRNDRARDLDNGMRATITALDEHDGATVRLDSGATRRLDPEYLAGHVEPAYALTGHGMQGGTVQWAAVIGQPHDFSRNWAYTALSRAREPTELFIVDEPGRNEQERQAIAPAAQRHTEDTIERMARRMRERDDEDLALEQLEHPQTHDERAADTANRHLSPARAHLYEVRRRLKQIHQERDQLPIQDAKTIVQHDDTITAIKQAHERDRRPQGWRDRLPHKTRKRQRELHIEQLRDHQAELLETTPDPRSVLERAEKLMTGWAC